MDYQQKMLRLPGRSQETRGAGDPGISGEQDFSSLRISLVFYGVTENMEETEASQPKIKLQFAAF